MDGLITKEPGRRYRLAHLPTEMHGGLADVLTGCVRAVNLPDDVRILRFDYDITVDAVAILIESRSFDPVPKWEPIPRFDILYERDTRALLRRYYRWWTISASRDHLKIGPMALSWYVLDGWRRFGITAFARWSVVDYVPLWKVAK